MSLVRLGKMHLRWCATCNLPLIEAEECGICSSRTVQVEITPPGDVRPAFRHDIDLIRSTVDRQFGAGTGEALVPEDKIVIMNKVPGLDRMDEVIIDGQVAGTLRYDLGKGFTFVTRMAAARAIQSSLSRGFVVTADEAVPFILKGLNLMAPGVLEAHPEVVPGDEVIVLTKEGLALCTGMARMTARDMIEIGRGQAVKARWFDVPRTYQAPSIKQSRDLMLQANQPLMGSRVAEAIGFIHKVMERNPLPAMVSFSGGKDSLVCLLLTLDAGLRLPVFFIDTGLEFPETVEYVQRIARKHDLPLIVESAPQGAFFDNLGYFGPPGRDYRWCCKTNKLGPTVQAILKHYPGGVLSFIGQRRYESEQRSEKPRVWKNPWTPGQIGASPIQEWTALHVWLYIFSKGEEYNPWYDLGLDRIGCFLCPASDLAELELVMDRTPRSQEWAAYLAQRAEEQGWPEEWLTYAMWRWRQVPDSIRKEVERIGVDMSRRPREAGEARAEPLRLRMQEGMSPCVLGYSIEGAFNRHLDVKRVAELLNMLGEVEWDEQEGWCLALDVRVFEEGALIAKGADPEKIRKNVEKVRRTVVKAEECVGCGVCVARCDEGALTLQQGKVHIIMGKCIHCGRCTEPCPAVSFGDSAFEL
jgi:phosphoadenosine phosphosulfate reductase